jgi:hypothetical protein
MNNTIYIYINTRMCVLYQYGDMYILYWIQKNINVLHIYLELSFGSGLIIFMHYLLIIE